MQTMRNLLSQNPMTFNELLDLFEAYVSTIDGPLFKARNLIQDKLDYHEGDIFGHIVGVVDDADQMAKRLKQIRAARNAGTDVTINISRNNALRLGHAIHEIDRVFSAAGSAFELLHNRAVADANNEDAGALAVMTLAQRALMDADEQEGAELRRFATRLRDAGKYQHIDQEEAA